MSNVPHHGLIVNCVELSNFEILHNIYLFSSSCLCPVGCLSFVSWKMNQNRYYVIIRNFDNYTLANQLMMRYIWHKGSFFLESAKVLLTYRYVSGLILLRLVNRVYLQDAKVLNQSFAMCNDGWIILFSDFSDLWNQYFKSLSWAWNLNKLLFVYCYGFDVHITLSEKKLSYL